MSFYAGTFLIALATLALEVALTRLLSVVTWYHLVFFAISTAMLGMTAAATTVFLRREPPGSQQALQTISTACMRFAYSVPFSLIVICLMPLSLEPSAMTFFALLLTTALCALPFYFSGIAITTVLTKTTLPIGKVYASDLVGAALGALLVLFALHTIDAPSVMILCATVGVFASIAFDRSRSRGGPRQAKIAVALCLIIVAAINSATSYGIRPLLVKGRLDSPRSYEYEKWNSFSRVVLHKGPETMAPLYWGPSPKAPQDPVPQRVLTIDGQASTVLTQFRTIDDIRHLRYDVTNVAHFIRPTGLSCVIGLGGGRDVQSAILFGHEQVVGIDVNPVFVSLLTGRFRGFSGLADHPGVRLVTDEARSYLTRSRDQFSVVQMSLIDTWAATGAGAFSLSENALYTLEAWELFLRRLTDDGIFTVSRWHTPGYLGETGRAMSLAVAALLETGAENPARHIAMVTSDRIATLLVSRAPFSEEDVRTLEGVCAEFEYDFAAKPGAEVDDEILAAILASRSRAELDRAVKDSHLNFEPTTDSNPYFFNMLKLSRFDPKMFSKMTVGRGNLIATLTLLALLVCLAIFAVITVLIPLIIQSRARGGDRNGSPVHWPAAAYFALIGAGFILVEIALIQRLSVYLGHPTYALSVLLFTIILSTGLGSLASERVVRLHGPWPLGYAISAAVIILLANALLEVVVSRTITNPLMTRILLSVGVIFPIGAVLGFFFPMGMRMVRSFGGHETPWYWALNGIMSVLFSALAVFIAIYKGISFNIYLGSLCYAGLTLCIIAIRRTIVTGESQEKTQQAGATALVGERP